MKWMFLALATVIPFALQAEAPEKPAPSTESDRPLVVCLGDSITKARYPEEMAKMIPVRVINAGVNGNTSREGLARLERDVLKHKPDLVVTFFGANDGRRAEPHKSVPPDEYERNLEQIVDRCKAIGAEVILGTLPPINPVPYFTRHPKSAYEDVGGLEAYHAQYRAAALRVAKAKDVPIVDLNQLLSKDTSWRHADGTHATEEGTRLIAGLMTAEVRRVLFTGVGAKPVEGAEYLFDGTREMLDAKWTYWEGPRFSSSLPIKWKIIEDPVDKGTVLMTHDPAAAGGKFGAADIVTKKPYRDFRLHVEFCAMNPGGNSGVYLQNRYEIQICDGDKTRHGMGTVINETDSPYHLYRGLGKWNAYDIQFRAARFQDGKRIEQPLVTVYFNGVKVHTNHPISQVWGGPNSGIDGGNDNGKGITDTPGGLKLQCEGHDVRYRNIWIKEETIEQANTDF